ncbi:20S rRNA accumulation 4 [Lecanosticta acicola]|uniref:20S rRNA accumulation 4 n=1 Tax=Lecanosticta acicola TaxID=111012 RepID=A0AAI8YWZ9_9PEZI|nr:20S rRNA accumulation 4 [Lecanosticta acicola]
MADYDSDSSGARDDIKTDVIIGYASKDPTSDDFSQLGGHATWLDDKSAPSAALAKCKVCHGYMNLLLQLYADLPDRFPEDERRVYIWACRNKTCRRKDGGVRGVRGIRRTKIQRQADATAGAGKEESKSAMQPATNLGETLFGVKPSSHAAAANPFAVPGNNAASSNPFVAPGVSTNPFASASSLAAKPPQKPEATEDLPQTFAEKARISSTQPTESAQTQIPYEPWPEVSAFPEPYPSYHIDAGQEYIDPEGAPAPSNVRIDNGEGSSGSAAEDKTLFESSMDKTFQKFADRLAQNPEQVVRYEFAGRPLLYSKTDAVGKLLAPAQENSNATVKTQSISTSTASKMPRCAACGAERVFELQLTPHAITELEADEISVDGMDWGTIILGVCSQDCLEKGKRDGEVGYVEEWVGVQWEELAGKRPA